MRHLKRPASGSHCGPDAPLRFILGLLIVVTLLIMTTFALDSHAAGATAVRSPSMLQPVPGKSATTHSLARASDRCDTAPPPNTSQRIRFAVSSSEDS